MPPRRTTMQPPMTTGFNGNASGYGVSVGSYVASTSGTTLQQANVNMNDIGLMDDGQQFLHQLDAPDMDFARLTEDGIDSNSGSDNPEGGSGDDQAELNQSHGSKRKRYHRHTQYQIQEMENFFRECPHPDDKQRKELGRVLGLAPLQVKFWFQNKRTQVKTQQERNENQMLRNENEKLRLDNLRYREAINKSSCLTCGGQTVEAEMSNEEKALTLENTRLKEEINRLSGIAARYVGRPFMRYANGIPLVVPYLTNPAQVNFLRHQPLLGDYYGGGDLFRLVIEPGEAERSLVVELAVDAMEELVTLAHMAQPLWVPSIDGTTTQINHQEYFRMFTRSLGIPPHSFKFESTRKTEVVSMSHVKLVEMFMNVNQWSTVFSSIVTRAMTVDVLSTGVNGNYNGAINLIVAEFQAPSPIVPTRANYFARYSKQHANGIWAVVDVSLEDLTPNATIRFRRRPSGCLIQELPSGYSKVTWIEHVEVDDRLVHHLYKPHINSGLAFGAQRWVGTLDRQCERLSSASSPIPSSDQLATTGIANQEARRNLIKLAERMMIGYNQGVSSTSAHTWTFLAGSGADDVRVMSKKCADEPGKPRGVVLCAATSFWVPASPKTILDFLRDVSTRQEWDVLANDGHSEEIARIEIGREAENCISLLRVNGTSGSRENMVIIQETSADESGASVIYAPVDIRSMNMVLAGADSGFAQILPSGVSILPDGTGGGFNGDNGGSLLTVAFQILVDSEPNARLTLGAIATVNGLITCTVDRIKSYAIAAHNALVFGNNAQVAGNNVAGPADGPMI